MKRKWTRGEKLLWATPILVGLFAVAVMWGPQLVRGALGAPQVWTTTSDNTIRSMALSANGEVLAAAGIRDGEKGWLKGSGTVYLWNARTGERLPSMAPIYTRDKTGHINGWDIWALALSPDATKIGFSRVGENWKLYDTATRNLLWSFSHPAGDAKFSGDGKFVALSDSNSVWLVNASNGKVRAQWKRSSYANSADIAWSPNGKWLANIGDSKANDPIEIHRTDNGKLMRSIPNISSHPMLTSVTFSPDGKQLLCASAPGNVFSSDEFKSLAPLRCYEAATGKLQWEVKAATLGGANYLNAAFCHAIFSPDGRTVAAYQYIKSKVFLLDSATGKVKSTRQFRMAKKSSFFVPPGLAFAPDGKRLFVRGKNAVLVWDLD